MDSNPQSERAALRKAIKPLADLNIPEGLEMGEWVARTLYCNRMITVLDVKQARAALAIEPSPEPQEPSSIVCTLCSGAAEYIEAEGLWRHAAKPPDLVICDKYGYPIQVMPGPKAAPDSQITVNPDRQQGLPCVGGTRIPVHLVVWAEAHGSALESYPDLSPQQIKECLLYASECVRWKIAEPAPPTLCIPKPPQDNHFVAVTKMVPNTSSTSSTSCASPPAVLTAAQDSKLACMAMVTLLRAKSTDEQWASYGPEYDRHLQDARAVMAAADALAGLVEDYLSGVDISHAIEVLLPAPHQTAGRRRSGEI